MVGVPSTYGLLAIKHHTWEARLTDRSASGIPQRFPVPYSKVLSFFPRDNSTTLKVKTLILTITILLERARKKKNDINLSLIIVHHHIRQPLILTTFLFPFAAPAGGTPGPPDPAAAEFSAAFIPALTVSIKTPVEMAGE